MSGVLRVLHAADSYLPVVGGIEVHLHDLVEAQRDRGDDARVLTGAAPGREPDPPWVRRTHGTPVASHPLALARAVRGELEALRPDVVHAHLSVASPLAWLVAHQALACGVPVAVTVHSMWDVLGPVSLVAAGGLPPDRVAWSAVSTPAARAVRRAVPAAEVAVVGNAVDLDRWSPRGAEPPDDPYLLAVMRLTRTKRTLPLVAVLDDVLSRVVGARAVVVGDGPQRAAADRALRRRGLDDRVALLGRRDRDEVHRLLGGAWAFVAPAVRESFGIAALEARSRGVPVVARAESGVADFVTTGVDGLLATDDAGLADHLVALLRDPALRLRLGARARAVAPVHDWDATCRATRALYAAAAERTPHGPRPGVAVRR